MSNGMPCARIWWHARKTGRLAVFGIGGLYSAQMAQALSERRRCERPLVRKMERTEICDAVEDGLIQAWSPDQISGRQKRRLLKQPEWHVSASTIYRWIATRGQLRTHWQQFLRRRGRARWVPRTPAKRPRRGRAGAPVTASSHRGNGGRRRRLRAPRLDAAGRARTRPRRIGPAGRPVRPLRCGGRNSHGQRHRQRFGRRGGCLGWQFGY